MSEERCPHYSGILGYEANAAPIFGCALTNGRCPDNFLVFSGCLRYRSRRAETAEAKIAAMLAALEALAGHTEGFCKRSGCPGCTQVLEEARAAIAAARGEQ